MAERNKERKEKKMERDTDHRGQQPGKTKAGSQKKNKQTTKQHPTSSDRREKQQPLGNPVLKPWPHWPRNNNRLATQCASPGPIGHATTTAWHPSAQALAPLATQQQPLATQCSSPGPIGHATTTAWQPSAQALAPLATKQQPLGNPVHKPWLH